MVTTQQLLDAVNAQILSITQGGVSEFNEQGDGAKMLNLEKLFERRDKLQSQIAAESGASGRFRPVQPINE